MSQSERELQTVWKECSAFLRSGSTETSYNTWFSPIVPVALEQDRIVLEVDDDFVRKNLAARYHTTIALALTQAAGRELIPVFVSHAEAEGYRQPVAAPGADNLSLRLNRNYTFDMFVIGASNRFAHAAAYAVACAPAQAYNPFFIYGGVGLGKTHLMQAIAHHIHTNDPGKSLMYTSSENFTNELIQAIMNKTNKEFRSRYRNVDVLLIDDIQFISRSTATQEELFHTFNTLHEAGSQIIISSDKPPKEIPALEERLRSRFEWGLIADVQKPDLETRIAILRKKAEREVLEIPEDVVQYIASKVESNIRELEGSLNRIIAYASLINRPLTLELAYEALKDMLALSDPRHISSHQVMTVVGDYYGITTDELKSQRRDRKVSVPRQICMFLLRDIAGQSLPSIGLEFGGRDHSTVSHAVQKVENELEASPQLRTDIANLRKRLTQGNI